MSRKIIWSKQAKIQRKEILKYWITRNQSKVYSENLNVHFGSAVNILLDFPELGRITEFKDIRLKIVKDYKIFYCVTKSSINIVALVDMRRNPKIIKKMLK